MSVGEIAGLIAAIALVAFVGFLAMPLLKLGKVLDETRTQIHDLGQESVPILTELQGTVRATNEELSKLAVVTEDVSAVSGNASSVSKNAAQMSSLLTITFGGPLIKTAAFTAGVRKALRRGPGTDLDIVDAHGSSARGSSARGSSARSSDTPSSDTHSSDTHSSDTHSGPVQPRRAQKSGDA